MSLDPYLQREKERYGHALPSREFMLQILKEQGVPVNEKALQSLLEITEEEDEIFSRRISAMLREGQIMRNRKGDICVVEKLDLIKGRVQGHADGFGFLIPDDGSPDLFLSAKEMHKALHGDRVMVREIGVDRRGRREGAIVEVLERAVTQLVGRLHADHGILFVEAENRRISQDILIPTGRIDGRQRRVRWSWSKLSSSQAKMRSPSVASSRFWVITRLREWKSKLRCVSMICLISFRRR